jgi:hypothetical protein
VLRGLRAAAARAYGGCSSSPVETKEIEALLMLGMLGLCRGSACFIKAVSLF